MFKHFLNVKIFFSLIFISIFKQQFAIRQKFYVFQYLCIQIGNIIGDIIEKRMILYQEISRIYEINFFYMKFCF